MGVVKSCLAILGLGVLLLVGACVAGFGALKSAASTVLDPHSASERVEKPEAEVKQAVYEYLDGATNASFGERAKVEYMSDGTMQLNIGKKDPYDMTMKVTFEPEGADATKVSATFNADRLAWSRSQKTLSTNLHRCIRDDFKRFATNLGNGSGSSPLDLDDLLVRARQRSTSRTLTCDLSGAPGPLVGDYASTGPTRVNADYDYTPPQPKMGKPDPQMGKPTMDTGGN